MQHPELAPVPLLLFLEHRPLPLLFRLLGVRLALDLVELVLDRRGLFLDFGERRLEVRERGLEVGDQVPLGVDRCPSASSRR